MWVLRKRSWRVVRVMKRVVLRRDHWGVSLGVERENPFSREGDLRSRCMVVSGEGKGWGDLVSRVVYILVGFLLNSFEFLKSDFSFLVFLKSTSKVDSTLLYVL